MLMGLLTPFLWLSCGLITPFSTTVFRNSAYYKGVTFPRFIVLGPGDLWDDLSKRQGLGLGTTHTHRVAACFGAQTYLGSVNEYDSGILNPDVGGASVAISSQ